MPYVSCAVDLFFFFEPFIRNVRICDEWEHGQDYGTESVLGVHTVIVDDKCGF